MKPGILVIGHGSRDDGWTALVGKAINDTRSSLGDVRVEGAFLELVEGRLIQDGIDRLEAAGVTHIFALPLFISSGSTHVDEIGWALGAYTQCRTSSDLERFRIDAALTYGRPFDDDPEVVRILLDRLGSLLRPGEDAGRFQVLFIAHGSDQDGFREEWRRMLDGLAAKVKKLAGFRGTRSAMLRLDEVALRMAELGSEEESADEEVLVVPVFLSAGYFTKTVIPRELDSLSHRYRYDGTTLLPHSQISSWIGRRAVEWLRDIKGT